MNRREALQKVTLMLGGAVSLATTSAILYGCKNDAKSDETATAIKTIFSKEQSSLMDELTEVIIPKTDTPGAKEAGVASLIGLMLHDCYTKTQQEHFIKGMATVEEESKKLGGSFASLAADKKIEVMKAMKALAKAEQEANEAKAKEAKPKAEVTDAESGLKKQEKKDEVPVPFFNLLRELTTFGYFSSEVGAKSNLNYVAIPGKYEGCIKITPDTKPYAL